MRHSANDFIKQNGSASDIVTRLDVLAITPTTAVVRVDMEKDAIGANFHNTVRIRSRRNNSEAGQRGDNGWNQRNFKYVPMMHHAHSNTQ